VIDQPEEERKTEAEEEARDDGEVEDGVLAAVNDVAGEFSEPEGKLSTEVQKRADRDEEAAKEEEHTAEFAERIHEKDSRRNEVKK